MSQTESLLSDWSEPEGNHGTQQHKKPCQQAFSGSEKQEQVAIFRFSSNTLYCWYYTKQCHLNSAHTTSNLENAKKNIRGSKSSEVLSENIIDHLQLQGILSERW